MKMIKNQVVFLQAQKLQMILYLKMRIETGDKRDKNIILCEWISFNAKQFRENWKE